MWTVSIQVEITGKNKDYIMGIASLNKKFGIGEELGFKEIAAGITAIEIDTALATASIAVVLSRVFEHLYESAEFLYGTG